MSNCTAQIKLSNYLFSEWYIGTLVDTSTCIVLLVSDRQRSPAAKLHAQPLPANSSIIITTPSRIVRDDLFERVSDFDAASACSSLFKFAAKNDQLGLLDYGGSGGGPGGV